MRPRTREIVRDSSSLMPGNATPYSRPLSWSAWLRGASLPLRSCRGFGRGASPIHRARNGPCCRASTPQWAVAACYLLSLLLVQTRTSSVGVLLVGRTLVGGADSLIITGGMLWALGRVPPDRSAQVIAWVGMSMFAAMAVGAPVGSVVFSVS